MSKIEVPFQVKEATYNGEEVRAKDAVILVALQRIANALESIESKLESSTTKSK